MTVIVSDKGTQKFNPFMADTIERLNENKVKGIAISAICADGNTITGYWNMSLQDKAIAETAIHYDCIDQLIMANRDRYFKEQEDDE